MTSWMMTEEIADRHGDLAAVDEAVEEPAIAAEIVGATRHSQRAQVSTSPSTVTA